MSLSELTVRQVMQPNPIAVPPGCPIGEVLELMNAARIGSVLVADDDRLLGIFTERDLLRRVADAPPGWRRRPVDEWMTADPLTIGPDVGWDEAVTEMQRRGVRHLPVVEYGRITGLLSTRMLMARRTEYLNQRVDERTAALRAANEQLLARDAENRYNLRTAGKLQTKLLLPQAPPTWPELRWAIHYAPLDHLGGDYYDFATPAPDKLGFLIADASGHSVAAALVAVMARFAFVEVANSTDSPGEVLTAMNRRLQGVTDERFVTAFYGVLDRRTRVLRFASAGHPYPLHYQAATGEVKPVVSRGFLLGIIADEQYTERTIQLAPDDRLCFFTDGLVEARNEIGEQFGEDSLAACFSTHIGQRVEGVMQAVLDSQRGFSSGVPLTDDLTLAVCHLG
jgi:phosphoserine phosphatase RsbU/P